MPTPAAGVIVSGYLEMQRSFTKLGPKAKKALNEGLRSSVEEGAKLTEDYSLNKIGVHHKFPMRRSPAWAVTRIGVTQHSVYIVPKLRGVKPHDPKNRPNLVGEMLEKSFIPAMQETIPLVERNVTDLLSVVIDSMNTGGF